MKLKKLVWLVTVFILITLQGGLLTQNIVLASEDEGGALGFYPTVEFPENQLAKDIGYFHLKMSPSQKQTIVITLDNPSKEKITVGVSINGAKTNSNGVIDYGQTMIEDDASLKFKFADVVTGPAEVEIAPGESKAVEFQIDMPETQFDGVMVGGIQFMKKNPEKKTEESGSKVRNVYAYLMGVKLQETDVTLKPDLTLNKVFAEQFNYRNAIMVNFSNTQATYVEEMTTEVQITKKGESGVVYETKKTGMRMAPNTFIDFPVDMNGERMAAGDYVADILVTSNDQKWKWSEKFTITAEEAAAFNERDVGLVQEKGIDWKLVVMILAGFICFFGIVFFIIRSIRKKPMPEKKKTGKKTAEKGRKVKKNR